MAASTLTTQTRHTDSQKNFYQGKEKAEKKKFVSLNKEDLQRDSNSPQTLISLIQGVFPSLQFKQVHKKYKCLNASIDIIKAKSGDWILNAWSNKFNVPSGGIFAVAKNLHNLNPDGNQDDFFQVWRIVAKSAGLNFDNYLNQKGSFSPLNNSPKPIQPKPEIFKVNQGYDLRQTYSYKSAKWGNANGKAVLKYWREKIGAHNVNTDDLQVFLGKYGIEPIKSITHLQKDFTIGFTGNNFAFTYKAGENVKGKRPNEQKYNKNFYIQSTGNYVCGYDQLPETGTVCFITGGESDCIGLNFHFNSSDVWAVCINGENNNINSQLVSELRERFDYVFTCLDNDKTGIENSIKNALIHGLPYVALSEHTDQNDICDIIKNEGIESLAQILFNEIATKTAIQKRKYDAFSIGVHNVLKLEIDRFIGEEKPNELTGLSPLELLKNYLLRHLRNILKAQAGNGKTWALMQIAICLEYLKELGVEQVIFCVPTTAIADQLRQDFVNRFEKEVPTITSKTLEDDILQSYESQIIITTYDSLHKIDWKIREALLIVDEFHELRNAKRYRNGACNEVFERMQIAKRVLCISATPLLHLTAKKIHESFNYQLIIVNSNQVQRHIIEPLHYVGTETDIVKNRMQDFEKGNHIIKKNDVALLEAWKERIGIDKKDTSTTILSSKHQKYKSENPFYQSIVESGKLPENADKNFVGLVTSLMDAGTSFRFQVDSMTIINPRCQDALIQHISRPRFLETLNGSINEHIKVYTYHKKPNTVDLSAPNQNHTDTLKSLKIALDIAKIDQETANSQVSQNKQAKAKYLDDLSTIYYSKLTGKWEIDILRILSNEYNRQMSLTTTEQFYKRIAEENPHIEILQFKDVDLEDDSIAEDLLNNINEVTKYERETALSLVTSEVVKIDESEEVKGVELAMSVALNTTKSSKLRQQIKEAFDIKDSEGNTVFTNPLDSELFSMDRATYEETIALTGIENMRALEKPVSRFLSLLSLNIAPSKIPILLSENGTDSAYRMLKNRIITQLEIQQFKADSSKLSGKEIARVKKYISICKAMNKKNIDRRKFSSERLRCFVGKAINDNSITFERALLRVSELYSICSFGRGDSKTYVVGEILSKNESMIELLK